MPIYEVEKPGIRIMIGPIRGRFFPKLGSEAPVGTERNLQPDDSHARSLISVVEPDAVSRALYIGGVRMDTLPGFRELGFKDRFYRQGINESGINAKFGYLKHSWQVPIQNVIHDLLYMSFGRFIKPTKNPYS